MVIHEICVLLVCSSRKTQANHYRFPN
uniref:Uncharacterized protein n=1 Tax=Anguilla anguilla TaxID=7936 RepID=A0A0E9U9M2_ANGAN